MKKRKKKEEEKFDIGPVYKKIFKNSKFQKVFLIITALFLASAQLIVYFI